MNPQTLKKVAEFGDVFREEYLERWEKERLVNDWQYSLEFFFDHTFMRGRNDSLSIKFKESTIRVLEKTLFRDLEYDLEQLNEDLKQGKVNNKNDRKMVCGSIEFIRELQTPNLTSYFISKLRDTKTVYNELTYIPWIGDEIATFYIRDLCWIFGTRPNNYSFVFPIDRWVEKMVKKLKLVNESERNKKRIKSLSIEKLLSQGISPIKFNAGAWYLGHHSFDILIEKLKNNEL